MMCIHSATIKDYVCIVIYYKQKPTVDFQNSCVTRMSEILESFGMVNKLLRHAWLH